jgi:hypothetical protein
VRAAGLVPAAHGGDKTRSSRIEVNPMRILRVRRGFQADHSSSSYLFYAVDGPVSARGRQVAHRFSSRAEVDDRTVRYVKWGESELSSDAYRALLSEHYDVMVSESYDSWTLMIAVPKTPALETLLAPFEDIEGDGFQRMSILHFGDRLVVDLFLDFAGAAEFFQTDEDLFEYLVESLVEIRQEIIQGNVSFLQAVADFYGEEDEAAAETPARVPAPPPEWSGWGKAQLQQECGRRGIEYRKSWTKRQLLEALTASLAASGARSVSASKQPQRQAPLKLSRPAREIVAALEHR